MGKYIYNESNSLWYVRQGVTEQLKANDQMAWVGRKTLSSHHVYGYAARWSFHSIRAAK